VLVEVGQGVADHHVSTRIVKCTLVHLGKMLAAQVHEFAVDIDHDGPLDSRQAQHLTKRRALAAASDQHPLRIRMADEGRVHQRLVIHELVGYG
jgi:hypothetical protein